jgi:hypothetical protein
MFVCIEFESVMNKLLGFQHEKSTPPFDPIIPYGLWSNYAIEDNFSISEFNNSGEIIARNSRSQLLSSLVALYSPVETCLALASSSLGQVSIAPKDVAS